MSFPAPGRSTGAFPTRTSLRHRSTRICSQRTSDVFWRRCTPCPRRTALLRGHTTSCGAHILRCTTVPPDARLPDWRTRPCDRLRGHLGGGARHPVEPGAGLAARGRRRRQPAPDGGPAVRRHRLRLLLSGRPGLRPGLCVDGPLRRRPQNVPRWYGARRGHRVTRRRVGALEGIDHLDQARFRGSRRRSGARRARHHRPLRVTHQRGCALMPLS